MPDTDDATIERFIKHADGLALAHQVSKQQESVHCRSKQYISIGTVRIQDLLKIVLSPPYMGHYRIIISDRAYTMLVNIANRTGTPYLPTCFT